MNRMFATAVVFGAVGVLLAAPVPAETRKPAAFPAGHYVLTGAGEPAQGNDVFEFTKTFRLRPGQYILSGGEKPTERILVDDDLEVYQEKTALFIDDDHVRSTENRGKFAAKYQGQPIVLVLDPAKKLRIVAIDCAPTDAILGQLWLHRWDGARKKLTDGKQLASVANLPATFFDEWYALGEGFEMPEKVSTDAELDVPAKPAHLLPRFKAAATSPQTPVADKLKPIEVSKFLHRSIIDGMTEDGIPPAFAAQLAKNDDFLGKCQICSPTHLALQEYGNLKDTPTRKEGKGLTEDLVKRLSSEMKDVRRDALREMVSQYTERAYRRADMTAEQRDAIHKELEQMRKSQADGLPAGQKFCPSCDGACRLLPKK
jgi:hypothetical protein